MLLKTRKKRRGLCLLLLVRGFPAYEDDSIRGRTSVLLGADL
jgi:hypothetical protein